VFESVSANHHFPSFNFIIKGIRYFN